MRQPRALRLTLTRIGPLRLDRQPHQPFSRNQERKHTNHVETEPGWTDLTLYP
jgi:hypothetical protein